MQGSLPVSELADCRLVDLHQHEGERGLLVAAEAGRHVPFEVRRAFWLSGMRDDMPRARHAHRTADEFLVAVVGAVSVLLDDARARLTVELRRPDVGLFVPAGIWIEVQDISGGAVCAVLSSEHYDGDDYWKNYAEFVADRYEP